MLGAASCSEDWTPPVAEEGSVNLNSLSVDMSDAEKVSTSTVSRASVDLAPFIVTVSNGADYTRTYTYGDMPEVLTLPVGSYTISVKSHEVQKAEWERPLYLGTKEFTVTKGKITDIGVVTASFASLKVTVQFTDDLKPLLGDDVKVTVIANDQGSLVYTPSETRAGFFEVVEGSNTMIARFEGTIDGVYTTQDTPFADVEAGQHRIVRYSAKSNPDIPEQSGGISGSGITLDTSVINQDINSDVIVSEDNIDSSDRPGQEEPDQPGPGPDEPGPDEPGEKAIDFVPFNSPNLDLDAENVATADFGNAIVRISASKGIKSLVVNIHTSNEILPGLLAGMGLGEPFDLANINEDSTTGDSVKTLNLPFNSQVAGQTEVDFNISDFVPLLVDLAGNHEFTITVTDNDNKAETMTLRFKS